MDIISQMNQLHTMTRQSVCEHAGGLDKEFEETDNLMPYLVSAVCEDCGKDIINELTSDEREELAIAYVDDLRSIHYNAEARYDS